jgi:hypothetical protein
MIVRRQDNWLTAKVGDEVVMMNTDNANYVGLTDVGARIWELIETPQDLDTICAQLLNEYDIGADTCRNEVNEFLSELVNHGVVALDT